MPQLQRRLGPGDAVLLGLGSMLGAGVFAVFARAAAAAGTGLLFALIIAAVVAYAKSHLQRGSGAFADDLNVFFPSWASTFTETGFHDRRRNGSYL